MKWFSWFDSKEAQAFARALAVQLHAELKVHMQAGDTKFAAKAEKALNKAARQVQDFKSRHPLNVYTKSRLANAFLWTLKDAQCPSAYADQLTEWLTLRL